MGDITGPKPFISCQGKQDVHSWEGGSSSDTCEESFILTFAPGMVYGIYITKDICSLCSKGAL